MNGLPQLAVVSVPTSSIAELPRYTEEFTMEKSSLTKEQSGETVSILWLFSLNFLIWA